MRKLKKWNRQKELSGFCNLLFVYRKLFVADGDIRNIVNCRL